MADTYDEMTLEKLRILARDQRILGRTAADKPTLVKLLKEHDEQHGVPMDSSETMDVSDYSDLLDGPFEDDDKEVEESAAEKLAEPPPPPEHQWYKLTNDIILNQGGLMCPLKAGRRISDRMYDIEKIKRAGGVLQMIKG